jgi:PAS domain S-box-containing protein
MRRLDKVTHKSYEQQRDSKEQPSLLKIIIDALPHPFLVINAYDYTIELANVAAEKGRIVINELCYKLLHNKDEACDNENYSCPLEKIKETKEPVTLEHVHFDKDGNPIDVEIHAYPLLDDSNNVSQIIEYCIDITDRKQIEAALRNSERKFRSVAQSATDAVISANKDGNIVYWNNAAEDMFGYAEGDILGKQVTILMPERFREDHTKAIQRLNEGGKPSVMGKTVELVAMSKIGEEFPIELSLGNWESEDDIFYTAIIRDTSERKRIEAERDKVILDLQEALKNVKTLSGLLPICASCKKIRDDQGYWNRIESYIHKHSDAQFSHGICPECAKEIYPDIDHKKLR